MSIATDLVAFLLENSDISTQCGSNVHYNMVPETVAAPYIWIGRSGTEQERTLDGGHEEPFRQSFDVEIVTEDPATSDLLGSVMHQAVDGTSGDFGTGTVQAVWVESQSDDYIPRGIADEGFDVSAFSVEIVGYTPGGD